MGIRGPDFIGSVLDFRQKDASRVSAEPESASAIPWTFNQILLPIIFVLTFVILTQILGYKNAFQEAMKFISQDYDKIEHQISIINLQLQKLHRAFLEAKMLKLVEYNATRFPNADGISYSGIVLKDQQFKIYCQKINSLLDEQKREKQARIMYQEVLQLSGINDPASYDRLGYNECQNAVDIDLTREEYRRSVFAGQGKIRPAKSDQMHPRNRRIIICAILDFWQGLIRHAAEVQYQLLCEMFNTIKKDPGLINLSQQDRVLITKMIDPSTTPQERLRSARDFYRNLIKIWQKRFDADGYPIVDNVWIKLKAL